MFIQVSETPNPETLKFTPEIELSTIGSIYFDNPNNCQSSPMVQKLFKIEGIKAVLLAKNFLSITKQKDHDWDILKTLILSFLVDYFISGKSIIITEKSQKSAQKLKTDDDISNQIIELIENKVRPAVAQDGGDIVFKEFKNGVVFLELHGACSGCPSATITLKNGIENMLKYYIPEVQSVEQI